MRSRAVEVVVIIIVITLVVTGINIFVIRGDWKRIHLDVHRMDVGIIHHDVTTDIHQGGHHRMIHATVHYPRIPIIMHHRTIGDLHRQKTISILLAELRSATGREVDHETVLFPLSNLVTLLL